MRLHTRGATVQLCRLSTIGTGGDPSDAPDAPDLANQKLVKKWQTARRRRRTIS